MLKTHLTGAGRLTRWVCAIHCVNCTNAIKAAIYCRKRFWYLRQRVEEDGSINDDYRIDYLRAHIEEMKSGHLRWCRPDGLHAVGCIDCVSFTTGQYSKRYGFIYVNKHDDGTGDMSRSRKKLQLVQRGDCAWRSFNPCTLPASRRVTLSWSYRGLTYFKFPAYIFHFGWRLRFLHYREEAPAPNIISVNRRQY